MGVVLEQFRLHGQVGGSLGSCCDVQEGGGRDLTRVGAVETQRIPERVGKEK